LAMRAAAAGVHRASGFVDADEWLARETGVSSTEARRALETAAVVEALPSTLEALAAGELSLAQAGEIAATEAVAPGSEAALLATARAAPLSVLREQARRRRHDATAVEDLARRQRRARRMRHWRDELGMVCVSGALPPEVGIPFVTRLDAETERARRAARRDGVEERWDAHAADGFAQLVAGAGRSRSRSADVVFVVDLRAYRADAAGVPGRAGRIVGGGPVPVATVRAAIDDDAFVKVAFHDGVEIQRVKHFGRHLRAELRTALELGPPPSFDGMVCACGCGRRYKLQLDHVEPLANRGATCLANLQPRTAREHAEKTEHDRRSGKLRGGGRRRRPPGDGAEPVRGPP
jgi:hypothetical protein